MFPWFCIFCTFNASLLCLPRVMSDKWMMRCGPSSQTSPTEGPLPLLSPHPPPNIPPNPPPSPPLHPCTPPHELLRPPLGGLCVTWAPPPHRLVSPLQSDQPDPNPIPPATLPVCRYTQSKIVLCWGFGAVFQIHGNIDMCVWLSGLALINRARTHWARRPLAHRAGFVQKNLQNAQLWMSYHFIFMVWTVLLFKNNAKNVFSFWNLLVLGHICLFLLGMVYRFTKLLRILIFFFFNCFQPINLEW